MKQLNIRYLCTQKNVEARLWRHFGKRYQLEAFDKHMSDYTSIDAMLIVEPVRVKGHYLSVYEVWKLFLARQSPKTKLLIAGFTVNTHPNFINLLNLHDKYDLKKAIDKANPCHKNWDEGQVGNGYGKVSTKLQMFFKGHNYNSIIGAASKVRQMLNNVDLSLHGSESLKREKEDFKTIWENLLWPKRNYFRSFYSRWYNYRDYFDCMPFFSQMEAVKAHGFINELQEFLNGKKELEAKILAEKEQQYRRMDPFSRIGEIIQVFRQIDAKYIAPNSIGNILLIDDDPHFHHQLKENLTSFSFNSLYTVEAAKNITVKEPIHLILLDLELNKEKGIFSGLDLISELKHRFPDTPLSVVSVAEEREIIELAIVEEGADFYLSKSLYDAEKWTTLFIHLLTNRRFSLGEILIFNQTQKIEEKPYILVVEDEKDWYDRIAELSPDYMFKQAHTIQQASDMLRSGVYDLVLLDLYFVIEGERKIEGLPFVRNIKFNYPDIPLIVVSAETSPEIMKEVHANGADRYLSKATFDAREWLEILNVFINLKQARDQTKIV
ncbi:response regulator [Flavilitoribacter nigricans]|uniref:Response regulatory domain-containing protein n=1 Tax=Flavilitoribacter nigricans (strain ATCC 23147 / DSM 23189 / NBRC 102662 / NCIMB 1420 / SS-2) TaxID=1122177 RepID=A0A2D0N5L7_FLAN2|nr:response regulator [Flavilitoribacter nigricans]PHN03449.1 hypothetical protein CRP01_27600 [Flavilitoribacter nigricans DSM 23189 = NBRC 102662]